MGIFDRMCYWCENKPGLWGGFYCSLLNMDLDQSSDLFKYGCYGGCSGYKYCRHHKEG